MRVLALSPHPDDAELGCGGTIVKLMQQGATVHVITFSAVGIRSAEFRSSMQILGVDNNMIWSFEDKSYYVDRQTILDRLMELDDTIKPGIVLAPSANDVHQDHQTVNIEAQRAFRRCTVLGYELPRNTVAIPFRPLAFSGLNEHHMAVKVEALRKHASQSERPYMHEEMIRSLARARGLQIGTKYAEAFEVLRWVI